MKKILLLEPEDFENGYLNDEGDLNVPLDEQTTLLLTREAVAALLDKITLLEEERTPATPAPTAAAFTPEIPRAAAAPVAEERPEQPASGSGREGKQISIFEALNRARGEALTYAPTHNASGRQINENT